MVAVLPVLLYPLLGIGTARMTAMFAEQSRTVVILGAADLPLPLLVEGHRFARQWFLNAADAEKLSVVSDLAEPSLATLPEFTPRSTAEEALLVEARRMRELLQEKQQLENQLATSPPDPEKRPLEESLENLKQRLSLLFNRSQIQVLVVIPADFARTVERRQIELVERVPATERIEKGVRPLIVQNSADEKSAIAFHRVKDVVQMWERSILKEQLQQSQLPATLTTPIHAKELDLAERKQVSANFWAKIFPALLVIMTLTGAFYPAVDLCAGEKERGTMETLLICPATRTEIVLGKFLTVLAFSVTTAILNLLSVGLTGKYMASLAMGGASSRLGDLTMPALSSLVWVFVVLIPLATLFSALCLAMATFARSSKEGQYYLTPLLMVTMGLMIFCLSPGSEMHPFYSVLPVIGPSLLLKGLLSANRPETEMYLYAIPVLTTSIGYSLLALWWAIEQFGSEDVLFREAEQFNLWLWFRHLIRDKKPTPNFAAAGFCFVLIVLLQFASWKPLQDAILRTPKEDQGLVQIQFLMVQQVATIATPALLMGILLTTSVRETFSLRWPGLFPLIGAAVLPFALHPLILEMMAHLQWFFPPAPAGMAELMTQLKNANLGLTLLAIGVTPAFCEEIAFRGFLLSGFRRKGNVLMAVLLSSFAFGIIHLIPQQVFNAMLLGILLGTMCVKTRSLWPGVTYHLIHNSLFILYDRFGSSVPTGQAWGYFFRWEEKALRYQPALLVFASLVTIGLLYCLLKSPPEYEIEASTSA